jgi:excisionase family DNA binding protein
MAPHTPTAKKLTLTVEEAAEVIGISRAQAYRCVKRGDLRAVQLGRRLVVPVVALEELLGMAVADEIKREC